MEPVFKGKRRFYEVKPREECVLAIRLICAAPALDWESKKGGRRLPSLAGRARTSVLSAVRKSVLWRAGILLLLRLSKLFWSKISLLRPYLAKITVLETHLRGHRKSNFLLLTSASILFPTFRNKFILCHIVFKWLFLCYKLKDRVIFKNVTTLSLKVSQRFVKNKSCRGRRAVLCIKIWARLDKYSKF